MTFDLNEWLNIAARWIHVFAGIMWVGTTYFFTWLDGRFQAMESQHLDSHTGKNVWMVHSGGFYLVEKQKKPKLIPQKLYWFKWEAFLSWLSGLVLLFLVYYMGGLMVDDNMEETIPMIAGIASLVLAWPVYDLLWKSKLASNDIVGTAVSYVLLVGVIYCLSHVMDGRAAYIHVGAIMGTLMMLNVWMRILPAQRKMVKALNEGKEPDLTLGERAKMRSKHNTFMAVPVVFIMISNHYPVTSYGDEWNWVILCALVLVGWGAAKVIRKA